MFDDRKLRKHQDDAIAFTYDVFIPVLDNFGIQTYIVYKENNKYAFDKYRKFTFFKPSDFKEMIEALDDLGYLPITYWLEKNYNNSIEKDKQKEK